MDSLISFITQYGIFAMILMVFLEYACFPVSSEIVLPLTGAAAAAAKMGYFPVTLVCSIAGLMGTYLIYSVSRCAGEKILSGRKERSDKGEAGQAYASRLAKCMKLIEKRGKYAVCISRVIPLFRTYIAFAAGFSGMPRREYLAWSFLGIAVWNSVLIACGYILGSNWSAVSAYYKSYKYLIIALLAVLILMIIAFRLIITVHRKRRYC